MESQPPTISSSDVGNLPGAIIVQFLKDNVSEFRELAGLRQAGWENESGDRHFEAQRQRADNANDKTKEVFFKIMHNIGKELDQQTSVFTFNPFNFGPGEVPKVLDTCLGPGGFADIILQRNRHAQINGISLPVSLGGHEVLLRDWQTNPRVQMQFLDITMLAGEMGIQPQSIPSTHADARNFSFDRPYLSSAGAFDLVFCDGQVLRTQPRATYREKCEATRLTTSQLVLALQRIRPSGTLVVLLHKVEAMRCVRTLQAFSRFSKVTLVKPRRAHAARSSFYMVAKNVQPGNEAARETVERLKREWAKATFGEGESEVEDLVAGLDISTEHRGDNEGEVLMKEFGEELIRLARPIWKIQADALRKAPFVGQGQG